MPKKIKGKISEYEREYMSKQLPKTSGQGLEDESLEPGKEYMEGYVSEAERRMMQNNMPAMKKGGMTKGQKKVGKVMKEFKDGKLHSGKKGPVVKNPKQAIAIALSEAGKSKMKKRGGGEAIAGMGAALAMGGMPTALPTQASARAGQALASRPSLPSQAQGVRPFQEGGAVRGTGAAIRGIKKAKIY